MQTERETWHPGITALFLTERGYQVTGYDVIPEAIATAREIASARGLSIQYEVMDVTLIPHDGDRFDVIVDSYCLNHIVFTEERRAVFKSIKARLKPTGYYLVSSSMYERSRHSPEEKVVDDSTGFAYDVYDHDCLYDPSTDYYYEPLVNFPSDRECAEACEDTLVRAIPAEGRYGFTSTAGVCCVSAPPSLR
jgi:SAM-dependent methyltransferase